MKRKFENGKTICNFPVVALIQIDHFPPLDFSMHSVRMGNLWYIYAVFMRSNLSFEHASLNTNETYLLDILFSTFPWVRMVEQVSRSATSKNVIRRFHQFLVYTQTHAAIVCMIIYTYMRLKRVLNTYYTVWDCT